ncbi:hypothetical protein ACOSP7_014722 [Xanthoceras sorbifolium]
MPAVLLVLVLLAFLPLDFSMSWIPSPPRSLKLNTDAAVKVGVSSFGTGCVIRDGMGFMLAASSKPIAGQFSSCLF